MLVKLFQLKACSILTGAEVIGGCSITGLFAKLKQGASHELRCSEGLYWKTQGLGNWLVVGFLLRMWCCEGGGNKDCVEPLSEKGRLVFSNKVIAYCFSSCWWCGGRAWCMSSITSRSVPKMFLTCSELALTVSNGSPIWSCCLVAVSSMNVF